MISTINENDPDNIIRAIIEKTLADAQNLCHLSDNFLGDGELQYDANQLVQFRLRVEAQNPHLLIARLRSVQIPDWHKCGDVPIRLRLDFEIGRSGSRIRDDLVWITAFWVQSR